MTVLENEASMKNAENAVHHQGKGIDYKSIECEPILEVALIRIVYILLQ